MDFKELLTVFILIFTSSSEVSSTSSDPIIETLYTNGPSFSEYFPLQENLVDGNTLRFSLRGSKDAHILLSTSPQRDQPEYEIVLGAYNNTINFIQGRNPGDTEPNSAVRTVNLLNEQEFRRLWIRLRTDAKNSSVTLQVGIGEEIAPFQECRDMMPLNPLYLSFRSGAWANWRYGYSDSGNTIGILKRRKVAIVTHNKNGDTYGQYHPLSDIMSHSADSASSTIYFTVRNSKELQILLSTSASSTGHRYEFGFKPTSVYLRRQQADVAPSTESKAEANIPNDNNRQRFWIRLTKDGEIMLGKGGFVDPIISWRDPNPIFPQFVGFTLIKGEEDSNPTSYAEIEYGLGPEYTLDSQDCEPRWKDPYDRQLPPGAVRGGYTDKDELFICRASHEKGFISGSFIPGKDNKGECYVAYNVNAHKKPEFQVLTGCNLAWVPSSLGKAPPDAIAPGEFPDNGKGTYTIRVNHRDQILIGKLGPGEKTAYIAFENQELPFTEYEVVAKKTS